MNSFFSSASIDSCYACRGYMVKKIFKVLSFTLRIVLPYNFIPVTMIENKSCLVRCSSMAITKLEQFILTHTAKSPGEHSVIIIGPKTAKELDVKCEDWVLLKKSSQVTHGTLALISVNEQLSDGEAILSETLLHNVAKEDSFHAATTLEIRASVDYRFLTASELELSLLRCPGSWDADDIDSLLANFLKTPRLFTKDDIVPLEAARYSPRLFLSRWDLDIEDATAWFRVESLKSASNLKQVPEISCMWVEKGITKVSLVAASNGKGIPSNQICPIDLHENLKELESAARTFLSNDVQRRPPAGCGFLLRGGAGRQELCQALGASLGLSTLRLNCRELQVPGSAGQPEAKLRAAAGRALGRAPCLLVLDNLEVMGWEREGGGEDARAEAALVSALSVLPTSGSVAVGVTGSMTELAPGIARTWLPGTTLPERPPADPGPSLKRLLARLESIRHEAGTGLGLARVPNVSWEDVGGLEGVRRDVLRTVALPLRYPALRAAGLRRSGLLLHGPPGTGKTLVAKAVASECGLSFISVKGPELLNMYVGQSEANVRDVFARARAAAPSVVFFDELDALAPSRGRGGDGGGNVTDRVVSQLMAEMDGLTRRPRSGEPEEPPVFVMAATNRPDLLLYVGPCEDHTAQLGVLKALTRKFHLGPDVRLEDIVSCLPPNTPLTGADLYATCATAWRAALRERVAAAEKGMGSKGPVEVHKQHFIDALSTLRASVNPQELATNWQRQQQQFGSPAAD
ncbi:hypothetical protein B566_EDAN017087 [Ephemera danica]|nr:hypothetical protein B566_EDAN017087 [Ephemera danica]